MVRLSNDNADLTPRTEFEPGRQLTFDFPGLEIGLAEYDAGPTGCTVFHFPAGAACATDVRGGSPGVFGGDYGLVQAVCLAGGSLYGLEASTGVAAELFARRDYSTAWGTIALVAGAIIFDYGRRDNAIYPDHALGRAALRAARPGVFPLGPRGAGRSATVGKAIDRGWSEPAGQGGAFAQFGDTRLAAFSVVNAVGAIVDRQGRTVRGHRDPATGQRRHHADHLTATLAKASTPKPTPPGNTTVTVIVTNQQLGAYELRQLGRQVHSSMARAIQPFHALTDGDVLFALTTNAVAPAGLDAVGLGTIASELVWDAVLNCFEPDGGVTARP